MSRRRRALLACVPLVTAGCGAAAAAPPPSSTSAAATPTAVTAPATTTATNTTPATTTPPPRARARPRRHPATRRLTTAPTPTPTGPPYAVGERTITFVDHSRLVRIPGEGTEPRTLVTVVRYPAAGPASETDAPNAPPARAAGPFPLVIFGHGYAVTPAAYYRLLRAWAQAGYVVAAPVFPLENAHAPGGPDETDLVNQPGDMSFVISGMLAASARRTALLAGTINPAEVGVAGQSDGGETALAVAYDRYFHDPRVRAAVILSGAVIPERPALRFGAGAPPLLATQGTADTINPPHFTYSFFAAAGRPKYLVQLLGAPHLPPYTTEQPQLGIIERSSIAFMDLYLEHHAAAAAQLTAVANRPGLSLLTARP